MEINIEELFRRIDNLEYVCRKLAESNEMMLETMKLMMEETEQVSDDVVMVMQVHNYPKEIIYRSITYPLNYVNNERYEEI